MEIVIKIDDDLYTRLFDNGVDNYDDAVDMAKAIRKGTVLPKGHGRIGDLDALEELCSEHKVSNSALYNSPIIEQGHYDDGDCIWQPLFDFAPTIIEADRSEK